VLTVVGVTAPLAVPALVAGVWGGWALLPIVTRWEAAHRAPQWVSWVCAVPACGIVLLAWLPALAGLFASAAVVATMEAAHAGRDPVRCRGRDLHVAAVLLQILPCVGLGTAPWWGVALVGVSEWAGAEPGAFLWFAGVTIGAIIPTLIWFGASLHVLVATTHAIQYVHAAEPYRPAQRVAQAWRWRFRGAFRALTASHFDQAGWLLASLPEAHLAQLAHPDLVPFLSHPDPDARLRAMLRLCVVSEHAALPRSPDRVAVS
jgi:hypothetical protein